MVNLKQIGAVAGITTLLGLGAGGLVASQFDIPSHEEVAVESVSTPQIVIDDPDGVLTEEDRKRMESNAERITAPSTVKTLHWIVFEETDDNVNDTLENFMRDTYPDEVADDDLADGVLTIGVGIDQRTVFVFAGRDVGGQLHLHEDERWERVIEAMRIGMGEDNIPAALFAGADKATDSEDIADYEVGSARSNRNGAVAIGGIAAGSAGLVGGGLAVNRTNKRRKAIAQGREDYELVTTEYAQLGQRLDEVDIRANSLSSAFADNEMREQWAEVRDRFLGMHDDVSGASGIESIDMDDDKQVWEHRGELASAAESVRHVSNAEDNIDRLFAIENGDAAARRSDLTDIREDVIAARLEVNDDKLEAELTDLEARINELDRNPTDPAFVDTFVRVLGDYRIILDAVKNQKFSDVKEHNALERPAIYDNNYYYSNYVPFVALNSWHSSNVQANQAAQASSSSGANTTFSSGFNAVGGSASY